MKPCFDRLGIGLAGFSAFSGESWRSWELVRDTLCTLFASSVKTFVSFVAHTTFSGQPM